MQSNVSKITALLLLCKTVQSKCYVPPLEAHKSALNELDMDFLFIENNCFFGVMVLFFFCTPLTMTAIHHTPPVASKKTAQHLLCSTTKHKQILILMALKAILSTMTACIKDNLLFREGAFNTEKILGEKSSQLGRKKIRENEYFLGKT